MNATIISWTGATWNPVHGRSRVSEGCRNCYAKRLSLQRGLTTLPWTAANAATNVWLKSHKHREPYKLKEPSRIFVNSMSDLFHPAIPDDYRAKVFTVMADLPRHTLQVLTKRPEMAATWKPWPPNVWMGVSIEDRKALHRLGILRTIPAATRFISFESLLEDLGPMDLSGIDWAIVGGESGPGYRPMPHAWARSIRDQCCAQMVAYFFKQSSAGRTELGTSLRETDNTFWSWAQHPTALTAPLPAPWHQFAGE